MDIEQVWFEYRPKIQSYLKKKIADPNDVEDILQDIIIKVYINLDSVKCESSLRPWLYKLANNTLIDYYRRKISTLEFDFDTLWYEHNLILDEQNLSKCIAHYTEKLPDNFIEFLITTDVHGISQKEYAELNDISYSTFKSRLQKGRKTLKALFNECCDISLDKQGRITECIPQTHCCNKC